MIPRLFIIATGLALFLFAIAFRYGPETPRLITQDAQVISVDADDGNRSLITYYYTVAGVNIAAQAWVNKLQAQRETVQIMYHPDNWGTALIAEGIPWQASVVMAVGAMLVMLGTVSIIRRSNNGRSKQEYPDPQPRRDPPGGVHDDRDSVTNHDRDVHVGAVHDGRELRQDRPLAQYRGRGPNMPSRRQGRW